MINYYYLCSFVFSTLHMRDENPKHHLASSNAQPHHKFSSFLGTDLCRGSININLRMTRSGFVGAAGLCALSLLNAIDLKFIANDKN